VNTNVSEKPAASTFRVELHHLDALWLNMNGKQEMCEKKWLHEIIV
jgi:hypothetical protein